MTSDLALSLFFEGIRLHRRTPDGWDLVGEVALDSADLAGDLAALARAGEATGQAGGGVRLLLPPQQVRTVVLDGERDLDAARAALDGLTPYAVDDLVIDRATAEGRTHVAAVARETLEEAQAFAAAHGFRPSGVAAVLSDFPREAAFVTPAAPAAPPSDVSLAADAPDLGLSDDPVPAPDDAPDTERDEAAPEREPEPEAPLAPPPVATAERDPVGPPADAAPADQAPPPPEDEPAGLAAEADDDTAPEPDPVPPSVAGPVPAPRPRGDLRAERPGVPPRPPAGDGRRVEPALRRPEPARAPEPAGWTLAAPAGASRADLRLPPPVSPPAVTQPVPTLPAAPRPSTPSRGEPFPLPRDFGPAQPSPAAQPSVIVFPARAGDAPLRAPETRVLPPPEPATAQTGAARRVRGKPRFLGLALTVILLVVMAAVAVLASVSENGLAGLLRRPDPVAALDPAAPQVATPDPQVASAGPDAAPVPPERPADPAPETTIAALPAPDAADPAPEMVAPAKAPAPSIEATQAAAAAVAAALAALPSPAPATEAPIPDAEPFYAATGVWLGEPRLALEPEPDPILAGPPVALSTAKAPAPPADLAAPEADAAPSAVAAASPPASDTDDAEPVVADVATPDAWVNAMAAPPSRFPPDRPAPPEGFAAAAPDEVQGPPMTGTDPAGTPWVNAMAAPPSRVPPDRPATPEGFAPPVPADLADAALPPGATGLAFADGPTPGAVALAGLRPSTRPGTLAPPEGWSPPPVILASYDGPRPGARPDALAPEPEATPSAAPEPDPAGPDVAGALAEAMAGPAPEALAATPDLQSTLAGILAGAPDPLAGTSAQAVAAARVPEARPRNFGRVVAQQLDRIARGAGQPGRAAGGVGTAALRQGGGGRGTPEEAEAGEAEVASGGAAMPSGVTPTTVAQAATMADAIALREINLVGVYGQPNARRALVRMGNGRYLRVGVGDALDGGQVTAIGDNVLNYTKRGRTHQLVIPGG